MRHARTLIVLLAGLGSARAQEPATWDRAVADFHDGASRLARNESSRTAFTNAARRFAELERAGMRGPELYGNLGNACYLAGQIPEAILAYRRGLVDAPWNRS